MVCTDTGGMLSRFWQPPVVSSRISNPQERNHRKTSMGRKSLLTKPSKWVKGRKGKSTHPPTWSLLSLLVGIFLTQLANVKPPQSPPKPSWPPASIARRPSSLGPRAPNRRGWPWLGRQKASLWKTKKNL